MSELISDPPLDNFWGQIKGYLHNIPCYKPNPLIISNFTAIPHLFIIAIVDASSAYIFDWFFSIIHIYNANGNPHSCSLYFNLTAFPNSFNSDIELNWLYYWFLTLVFNDCLMLTHIGLHILYWVLFLNRASILTKTICKEKTVSFTHHWFNIIHL